MADDNIRVLQCLVCRSLEELPDYEGPHEGDILLATLVERHRFESGEPHKGHLHRIDAKHWNSPSTKKAIIAQINEKSGHTGLDPAYYDAKNTFQLDALTCWKRHNKPAFCSDYKRDDKEIKPDTRADRKAEGLGKYEAHGNARRFVCEFCVCHSYVQQAARRKAGLDK